MHTRVFRRVLYCQKKKYLITNPKTNLENCICFFSKDSKNIVLKKQYEKLILFLKWFKRYQKSQTKKIFFYRLNVFPIFSMTKKPLGIRMGRGKGDVFQEFCNLQKGQLFFEVYNVSPIFLDFFLKKIISFFNFSLYFS